MKKPIITTLTFATVGLLIYGAQTESDPPPGSITKPDRFHLVPARLSAPRKGDPDIFTVFRIDSSTGRTWVYKTPVISATGVIPDGWEEVPEQKRQPLLFNPQDK